jgi:SAM-dependent methyltransferase
MEAVGSIRLFANLLLMRLRNGSPRRYSQHWEKFWSSIDLTGKEGQVLWDSEPERASAEDLERFRSQVDESLPLLDLGCGNGRQTRFLARSFSRLVGVDVSAAALDLARQETPAEAGIDYRVLDATRPEQARALHRELGDVNIYMRGVFHIIQRADRSRFLESLRILLGERGTLYMIEIGGNALACLRTYPGDSPSGLPRHVHRVVENGVIPVGFGPRDRATFFSDVFWDVLAEGPSAIHTIPLGHGQEGQVPAIFMLLRPRPMAAAQVRKLARASA